MVKSMRSRQELTSLSKSSDSKSDGHINDSDTNTVFLTQALAMRYPSVYWPMRINLEANGITVKTVNRTKNIWIRDYFPIQTANGLIRFKYDKRWDRWPQLSIENEPWTGMFDRGILESSLVIDGGNIVQGYGNAIVTDKIFESNDANCKGRLEKFLDSEVIVIPKEPGDTLGHSDGICRFIDERTVLINDYSGQGEEYRKYADSLRDIFSSHVFDVETIPNGYGEWPCDLTEKQFHDQFPDADEFNPAFGYYINFLQVGKLILMPAMKAKKDTEAMSTLMRLYPDHNIVVIDCSMLSMEGGLLHCVSANYSL